MSRLSRRAALLGVATLLIVVLALVEGVAARGGRGGSGRGGGGFNRGGGEISRGGTAAGGSLGPNQPRIDGGEYDRRGPAADGSLDLQHLDHGERQERREERRDERQDRRDDAREDWQESIEDRYDDGYYYGGYYEDYEEPLIYWTLPCSQPTVMALGGVLYYVCGSTWYIRVYYDGEVAYTVVENPTGH